MAAGVYPSPPLRSTSVGFFMNDCAMDNYQTHGVSDTTLRRRKIFLSFIVSDLLKKCIVQSRGFCGIKLILLGI